MQSPIVAGPARMGLIIVCAVILLFPQALFAQAGETICTVAAGSLNLRSGPGTHYTPPKSRLQSGAQLRLLTKNRDASWVQVQVVETGQIGWVSTALQSIDCADFDVRTLPEGEPPPPPADGPFAARSGVRPVPTPGANAGDLLGLVYAGGSFAYSPSDSSTTLTFEDEFAMELVVFDPRVGLQNGAGIDSVYFEVYDPEGEQVYEAEITAPPYCVPTGNQGCGTISLTSNGRWPNGQVIQEGEHYIQISAYPEDEELRQGNWNLDFEVQLAGSSGNTGSGNVQAEIVESFRSNALVFQVAAYDPAFGTFDGAGIANVSLYLYGPDGELLYDETEESAPYCLFSNASGSSTCNTWRLAQGRWPNGQAIRAGSHTLYAVATAESGRQVEVEQTWQIQIGN